MLRKINMTTIPRLKNKSRRKRPLSYVKPRYILSFNRIKLSDEVVGFYKERDRDMFSFICVRLKDIDGKTDVLTINEMSTSIRVVTLDEIKRRGLTLRTVCNKSIINKGKANVQQYFVYYER